MQLYVLRVKTLNTTEADKNIDVATTTERNPWKHALKNFRDNNKKKDWVKNLFL